MHTAGREMSVTKSPQVIAGEYNEVMQLLPLAARKYKSTLISNTSDVPSPTLV